MKLRRIILLVWGRIKDGVNPSLLGCPTHSSSGCRGGDWMRAYLVIQWFALASQWTGQRFTLLRQPEPIQRAGWMEGLVYYTESWRNTFEKKDNEEQDSLHTAKRNIHGKEEETTFVQTCTGASAVNSTKSGPLLSIQRTLKFKIFAPCASRWNCWVRRGLRRVRLMACCQQQPLPQILWPKENRRDNRSGGGGGRSVDSFNLQSTTRQNIALSLAYSVQL